jgi:CRISPR-associated protein Cas2
VRRWYLTTYDISDDKRLRKVFKAMNDYGDHMQFSVFLCELSDVERIRMEARVKKVMNEKEDQVIIVDLGPSNRQVDPEDFYALGRPLMFKPRAMIA